MDKSRKISVRGNSRNSHNTLQSQLLSVLCLFVLVFYLLRPALPFVEYALNKDYIAKNLCVNKNKLHNCCQGKCYLHEQLKKAGDSPASSKDENKNIASEKKVDDHLKSEVVFMPMVEKTIQYAAFSDCYIISSFLSRVFIPPRF
jgi:hypothetical protein